MPDDADRAGTPAGVFGTELRFYRTRAGLSQENLASRANVSHDVISKIETGSGRQPTTFRLDAIPELDTRGALTRLWDHLKRARSSACTAGSRSGPTSKPRPRSCAVRVRSSAGLLQIEDYARAIP